MVEGPGQSEAICRARVCLADLPRSEESHHRGLGETLENGSMEVRPANLLLNIQWS